MRPLIFSLLLWTALTKLSIAQPLQLEWLVEYPCYGPSGLEYDRVLTDETQNVYLCGKAPSPSTNSFYSTAILTQKYDSTGVLQWEAFFDGKFGDSFKECKFKDESSLIVGGTRGSLPGSLPNRAELTNYDIETGNQVWYSFIFDTIQQGANLEDFDIDSEGNIYAFGIVTNHLTEYDSNKMFVSKLSPTSGNVIWKHIFQKEFNATKGKVLPEKIRVFGGKFLGPFDYVNFIMDIDLNGNIIESVNLPRIIYGPDIYSSYFFFDNQGFLIGFGYQVTKFDLSETPEWSFDFARGLPNTIGQAKTATHDEEGNIYATGYIRDTVHHREYTQTVKIAPNGELLWATVDTFSQSTDFEQGELIAISDHHVFVCSQIAYNTPNGPAAQKIDYRPILYSVENGAIRYDTLIDLNVHDLNCSAHYGKGHFYLLGKSYLPGSSSANDYRYKLFKFGVEEPSAVGDRLSKNGHLGIFPNPFDASATIETKGIESNKALIFKLLDVTGRTVQQQAFLSPKLSFQRENLPSGLYFIKIESEDGQPVAVGRVVAK